MSRTSMAVIMDPIESIKPEKDSSFAMLLEAQRRGWDVFTAQLKDIGLRDGQAFGRLTQVSVNDDPQQWFQSGDATVCSLGDIDVILMRKDPPFDMEYIVATYVLERAEDQGSVVVNRPQGLRDANEKVFLSWFADWGPPTLITRCLADMREFVAQQQQVIVKPLDRMGGRSVFRTGVGDGNQHVILETVSNGGSQYVMLQRYIPAIAETGDRRILLIDGHAIPVALARIPSAGDHRGNIVAGARVEVTPLTERENAICEALGPVLREKGLLFAGIDVIGDCMTEINVTSPTGIRELERESECEIAKQLFDAIADRLG